MSSLAERRAAARARQDAARLAVAPAPEPAPPTKPCASCGAPVVWAHTVAKRRVPLDPPLRRGVVSAAAPEGLTRISVVDEEGRTIQIVEHPEGEVVGRQNHFISCPNAKQHRKPREPSGERRPRTARPAERRVSALPLDEGALLHDQPQPTEPAGTRCWVATTSQGPDCTIQLDDGRIVRGYRVPEGWTRSDDLTLVYVGRCVSAVWVDAVGRWITDELGRSVLGPAVGGGVTLHREALETDRLQVVDAVPPPLPSRTS